MTSIFGGLALLGLLVGVLAAIVAIMSRESRLVAGIISVLGFGFTITLVGGGIFLISRMN